MDDMTRHVSTPLPERRSGMDRRQQQRPVECDRRHGERRSYQRGCRCTPCRAANAAYWSTWHQARQAGRPLLGTRVPARTTHIAMKLLRVEQFGNQEVADLLGWHSNYARVRAARTVTLRTQLKVLRLYRERCLADPDRGAAHA